MTDIFFIRSGRLDSFSIIYRFVLPLDLRAAALSYELARAMEIPHIHYTHTEGCPQWGLSAVPKIFLSPSHEKTSTKRDFVLDRIYNS